MNPTFLNIMIQVTTKIIKIHTHTHTQILTESKIPVVCN